MQITTLFDKQFIYVKSIKEKKQEVANIRLLEPNIYMMLFVGSNLRYDIAMSWSEITFSTTWEDNMNIESCDLSIYY